MEFVQTFVYMILLEGVVFIHASNEELDVGPIATMYNQTETAYNFWVLVGKVKPEKYSLESFRQDQPFFKDRNATISNQTVNAYKFGVLAGIINPQKYSLQSFEQDQPFFKDSYAEFVSWKESEPITYQEWLVMNNYGLLVDTQESLIQKKTSARRRKRSKKRFMRTVNTGDILISSKSHSGLIGHAAIMVTDYWVLEMAGGRRWKKGIRDNNRQISKGDWYNEYRSETTTVYRCPDSYIAEQAAYWADRNYYNRRGGSKKTIHVTYKITSDFKSRNPSYSSKLVLQAYYYGTRGVIRSVSKLGPVIAPTNIPAYFMSPYDLHIVGEF